MASTTTRHRRTFGRIFKVRASDNWYVRYRVSGNEFQESSGSPGIRKAEKLLARREAELGLGTLVAPNTRRTTLGDLAGMLREDYTVNHRKSLSRAERSVKHLIDHSGSEARTVVMTTDRITRYIACRQASGAAPATIGAELAALKRMFTLGLRAARVVHRGPPADGGGRRHLLKVRAGAATRSPRGGGRSPVPPTRAVVGTPRCVRVGDPLLLVAAGLR